MRVHVCQCGPSLLISSFTVLLFWNNWSIEESEPRLNLVLTLEWGVRFSSAGKASISCPTRGQYVLSTTPIAAAVVEVESSVRFNWQRIHRWLHDHRVAWRLCPAQCYWQRELSPIFHRVRPINAQNANARTIAQLITRCPRGKHMGESLKTDRV